MKFTNSPYEEFMQEPSHIHVTPGPLPAPKGTPCHGCPYWKGILCVLCYRKLLKRPPRRG